jgi:hypothetical protein
MQVPVADLRRPGAAPAARNVLDLPPSGSRIGRLGPCRGVGIVLIAAVVAIDPAVAAASAAARRVLTPVLPPAVSLVMIAVALSSTRPATPPGRSPSWSSLPGIPIGFLVGSCEASHRARSPADRRLSLQSRAGRVAGPRRRSETQPRAGLLAR